MPFLCAEIRLHYQDLNFFHQLCNLCNIVVLLLQLRPLDAYNARRLNDIRSSFLQIEQSVGYVSVLSHSHTVLRRFENETCLENCFKMASSPEVAKIEKLTTWYMNLASCNVWY